MSKALAFLLVWLPTAVAHANCRDVSLCTAACERGAVASCTAAGQMLMGRERDKARELLDKACKGGHSPGCTLLAVVVRRKDPPAALAAEERGCDLDDGNACYAASLSHAIARDGKEVVFAERACTLGDVRGCFKLGDRDPQQQLAWFLRACDADPLGCCEGVLNRYQDSLGLR